MDTSPSLANKIAKQRQAAFAELPKARLCAAVVLAMAREEEDTEKAVAELKAGLGHTWSYVTALQYMSGRQAMFAAECGEGVEQTAMLLAHTFAKAVCDRISVRQLSFAELRSVMQGFSKQAAG